MGAYVEGEGVNMKVIVDKECWGQLEKQLPDTIDEAVEVLLRVLPESETARIVAMTWEEKLTFQVSLCIWIH